MKKRIFLTNDDGIQSDGLWRLAEAALEFGEVWIVAPDDGRSSMSHSTTFHTSFDLWETAFPVPGVHAFACSGTPADCVRIGVLHVVPEKPDHVFAGINYGYNTATDLQYSATVGAAFEAEFQGIPAIALSEDAGKMHEVTDHYLQPVLAELLEKKLQPGQIWNVNFPGCPLEQCRGVLRDRKVSRDVYYQDYYHVERREDGKFSCQVEGVRQYSAREGTDLRAIFDRYVSIGVVNNLS